MQPANITTTLPGGGPIPSATPDGDPTYDGPTISSCSAYGSRVAFSADAQSARCGRGHRWQEVANEWPDRATLGAGSSWRQTS